MERSNGNVSISSDKKTIKGSLSTKLKGSSNSKSNQKISKSRDISNGANSSTLLENFIFGENFKGWILITFRFIFYGMMAIDSWLEIPRASNFIGQFNLSHFGDWDWFNRLLTPLLFISSCLVMSILSIGCSLNLQIIRSQPIIEPLLIAILKGLLVFSSQSDNYQHHYLLVLVLFTLAFETKWYSSSDKDSAISIPQKNYSSWPLKLLFLELSVLYFWTAIAKMHPSWINGSVLPRMIGPQFQYLAKDLQNLIGYSVEDIFQILSISTIASELFLLVSIHIESLKIPSLVIGVSMHWIMGISGLRIGTFSIFMVIFYIPLLPNPFYFIYSIIVENLFNNQYLQQLKTVLNIKSIQVIGVSAFIYYGNWIYNLSIEPQPLIIVKLLLLLLLSIVTLFLVFSNHSSSNNNSKERIRNLIVISSLFLMISSHSNSIIREYYSEMATGNLSMNNLTNAIKYYKLAEKQSYDSEWIYTKDTSDDRYEFIGDLGLFLETNKSYTEALDLYNKYKDIYPNQLKIKIGLIRTLQELGGNSKQICQLLPNVKSLAQYIIINQGETCHNINCDRKIKHANYALQTCLKIEKLNKCLI
ncbi:hypothetical protein DLAC_11749 [Tieghemostelium lacteum]|uniref:HTTM domain-containing protein n=1 Tax=Tieghemostelium lacteum TaxID=361077 RepID=A0A151Z8I3_TIELA|nr:hypothetical protein DLAC_11749 [Tieghemostelium lacteum]|eukprot:KYQ90276.1 hypothetical protein DLAC_11749 [Tieghemostelium lacteum]